MVINLAAKAIIKNTEYEFGHYFNTIEDFNFFKLSIPKDGFNNVLNSLKRIIFVEISIEQTNNDL
ncbi:hypothetical protein [Polaribacter sp. M15]